MGGLFPKMKITALTMLVGVLAIAGVPLFSGWYSKDAILAQAFGFVYVHPEHVLLFLLPLVTAGHHDVLHVPHVVHDLRRQAARPPRSRTRPRIAVGDDRAADRAGGVQRLRRLGLAAVGPGGELPGGADRRGAAGLGRSPTSAAWRTTRSGRAAGSTTRRTASASCARDNHAGWPATWRWASSCWAWSSRRCSTTTACSTRRSRRSSSRRVHAFLTHKWYFDELYSAMVVRPAPGGRPLVPLVRPARDRRRHPLRRLRRGVGVEVGRPVRQRRRRRPGERDRADGVRRRRLAARRADRLLRSYVLFLVLAAVGVFLLLTWWVTLVLAG